MTFADGTLGLVTNASHSETTEPVSHVFRTASRGFVRETASEVRSELHSVRPPWRVAIVWRVWGMLCFL